MPWWMPVNDHLAFEEAIIEALAFYLSSNADARARRVYIGLQERLRVNAGRSRLLEQFSETVYLQVICWVAANDNSEKVADLREAFLEVAGIFGAYTAKKPVALIWDKAKVSLLDKLLRPANAGKAISYWLIDVWSDLARYDETVLIRGFLSLTIATKYLPDVVRDRRGNSSLKPADVPGDKHEDDETMTNDEPAKRKKKGTKKQRGVVDDALNDDSAKDARQLSESPMDKDGAIVANAGLILVAPFLPELFRQCKVVKGKQIKNYNKAIAITHYIAHGNCNYREYDVLLNKLLCGVDEHMTIRILKTLSKSDRNEIDTMLTSLIAHWSVLGSTSVAGLREGFLMRHGKLVSKYDEWFLVVERSPIDVLVQQIPWTIGMVKLPWMKKMIKTEWV